MKRTLRFSTSHIQNLIVRVSAVTVHLLASIIDVYYHFVQAGYFFLPLRTHQYKNERNHNSSDTRESRASTKSHIPRKTKQLLSIMLPAGKIVSVNREVADSGSARMTFQESSESGPRIFCQSSKKPLPLVASLIRGMST